MAKKQKGRRRFVRVTLLTWICLEVSFYFVPWDFITTWKAKCPIFKAIVADFRGKVAPKNRTLGVPGKSSQKNSHKWWFFMVIYIPSGPC